ncbi:MAG: Glycosyltransferase Gtf1 [Firmicutes bacterium ADurb.Bin182]|nr:MAG: Glycosyltransferase Gtf1 [Firmicutes bacterium ADurb.Bin182]
MKKYEIGMCGHFDSSAVGENGQTIRTNNIRKQITKHYGESHVRCISTHQWRKHPVSLMLKILKLCFSCKAILLFPNTGSVRVILPLCVFMKNITRIKVYYNVIGGWLPKLLSENKKVLRAVKKTDMLFIQTETMKKQLAEVGVLNTVVFPNFKDLKPVGNEDLHPAFSYPLPCCFISRVTERKGVEDAINAIQQINRDEIRLKFDIYGPIDETYKNKFEAVLAACPDYIAYKGVVDNDKTAEVLKNYFVQVFPTHYATEGHPGSLIDSLYAGLPVVASRWNSCDDVVIENVTGVTYDFASEEALTEKLLYCLNNQEKINAMRVECVKATARYSPEEIMKIMYRVFDTE